MPLSPPPYPTILKILEIELEATASITAGTLAVFPLKRGEVSNGFRLANMWEYTNGEKVEIAEYTKCTFSPVQQQCTIQNLEAGAAMFVCGLSAPGVGTSVHLRVIAAETIAKGVFISVGMTILEQP